jgi:NADH dehydrogenase (ubiquinone) Fe-S protein 4
MVEYDSEGNAITLCKKNGWKWFVEKQKEKKLKSTSYGVNFSWNKITRISTR